MQLSQNFSLQEFVYSPTAVFYKIDNTPTDAVVAGLKAICENVLQPLRTHLNTPVKISSGYRCHKLNEKIHSKPTSQHIKGQAVDFVVPQRNLKEVFDYIRTTLPYDQLLFEYDRHGNNWIHLSYVAHGYNRHQAIDNYKA